METLLLFFLNVDAPNFLQPNQATWSEIPTPGPEIHLEYILDVFLKAVDQITVASL